MDARGPDRAGVGGLRPAASGERGFTLVELLVVMLILSILAAIAIPAFFGQRAKAYDAEAKLKLASAERAIETLAVEDGGSYTGATVARLVAIEGTLAGGDLTILAAGATGYHLRTVSRSGSSFDLLRQPNGELLRSCDPSNAGGCGAGEW